MNMSSAAAIRQQRYRQREASGRVLLQVECDELELVGVLRQARQLDAIEPTKRDLERGLEKLLELLARS